MLTKAKVINFFKSQYTISFIIVAVLSLLVLFAGPYLFIANVRPLESMVVRLYIILSLVFLWGIGNLIINFVRLSAKTKQTNNEQNIQLANQLNNTLTLLCSTIKQSGHFRRNLFKKQSCFLLLGKKGAGKSTLMDSMGSFTTVQTESGDAKVYGWLNEKATIFELAEDYLNLSQVNLLQTFSQFLLKLKKLRGKYALNGIIILMPMEDLLPVHSSRSYEYSLRCRNTVNVLSQYLKLDIPIYLVISKSDTLPGFNEVFADLSVIAADNPCGFLLREAHKVEEKFNNAYNKFVTNLNQLIFPRMQNEQQQQNRAKIFNFNNYCQLIRQTLLLAIKTLVNDETGKQITIFNGAYFTSAQQDTTNDEYSWFRASLAVPMNNANNQPPKNTKLKAKPYFIRGLFNRIIFTYANDVGALSTQNSYRQQYRNLATMAAGVFVASSCTFCYLNYDAQADAIYKIKDNIMMQPANDFEKLNSLEQTVALAKSDVGQPLYNQVNVFHPLAQQQYIKVLQKVLWPYIVQTSAWQVQNQPDRQQLYQALKLYLMLADASHRDLAYMQRAITINWQNLPEQTQQVLNQHLSVFLQYPLPKIILDQQLIDQARLQLYQANPIEHIYTDLKQSSQNKDLNVNEIINNYALQVFNQLVEPVTVPWLYTKPGYEFYVQQSEKLIKFYLYQDWVTGPLPYAHDEQAVQKQLDQMYAQEYLRYWEAVLQHLSVRKLATLQQANDALTISSGEFSPILQILQLLKTHTNLNSTQSQQLAGQLISSKFTEINALTDAKNELQSYAQLQKSIGNIQKYLANILQNEPLSGSFKASKELFADKNNLFIVSKIYADTLPEPIRLWFMSLTNQTLGLILENGSNYINDSWQNQIMINYNQLILSRYPFNPASKQDVTIEDFNRYFAAQNILQIFMQDYLAAFFEPNNLHQAVAINGLAMPINPAIIKELDKAKKISQTFYATNKEQPYLKYYIKPVDLSPNAIQAEIKIGGQSAIIYRHDPQEFTSLEWPGALPLQGAMITITDTSNKQTNYYFEGVWGWYRLLCENKRMNLQTEATSNLIILGSYYLRLNSNKLACLS